MHYFALLENNRVTNIIIVNASDISNRKFPDSEKDGQFFLHSCGIAGNFLEVGKAIHRGFPRIGDTYDRDLDEFVSPEPEPETVTE